MNVKIALDIPEEHSYIVMVRLIGRTLLEHHSVVAQDIDDVETVVGELCANVTHHARSEAGFYRVEMEHRRNHLLLSVADQGRGFDPAGILPIGELRSDGDGVPRYGGYGLHLVRTLTDQVEIKQTHPTGITVRAEKYLSHELI